MATMVGQRVRRLEDPRFLTGQGRYVDDLRPQGELHVVYVRSDLAHARISSIDTSEAAALPGVQVFTAAELEVPLYPAPPFVGVDEKMSRPPMARDRVRFVGEIVAAVLAETRAAAIDAASRTSVTAGRGS